MKKYRVNSDSWTVLADMLAGETPEPFQGNSMSGNGGPAYQSGQLPAEYRSDASKATYVIYSYSTPVAWRRRSGEWVVPAVRYSVTTSKQLGRIRPALARIGGYTEI